MTFIFTKINVERNEVKIHRISSETYPPCYLGKKLPDTTKRASFTQFVPPTIPTHTIFLIFLSISYISLYM